MAMVSISNGNIPSPPELDPGVVKIVVIGERRVGKSRFIHTYYNHHVPDGIDSHYGVRWYNCELTGEGQHWRTAIFEIPGDPECILEQKTPHYKDAKVFIFMYAVDDPVSLQRIIDRWLPETRDFILSQDIPVVLVGNKIDLRGNRQVIERLSLMNQEPVTYQQGNDLFQHEEITAYAEISSLVLEDVNGAFDLIFKYIIYQD